MPRVGRRLERFLNARMPRHFRSELFRGIERDFDVDQDVELEVWWRGSGYEAPTAEVAQEWARKASVFFDVGANMGIFALLAVDAGVPAVHAFEPNPLLAAGLRRVCAENSLTTLSVHEMGLSDADAELDLFVNEVSSRGTFGHHPDLPGAENVRAKVTTFDGWRRAQDLALPAAPSWVLKMDVEGFELPALCGMDEALDARAFSGLIVELNEYTSAFCGTTVQQTIDHLAEHGYVEVPGYEPKPNRNAFFVPV
jgi:FkbM family methyltransferase